MFGFRNAMPPIRLCEPITINAKKFYDKYGEFFLLKSARKLSNGIEATFGTGYGEDITIKRLSSGIFINDEFFCDSWKNPEIDTNTI